MLMGGMASISATLRGRRPSSTCGNSMRENREIPYLPLGDGTGGGAGKVIDRNPAMHGYGKSDSPTVLTKPSNQAEDSVAEVVEGRGLTKENTEQQNTSRTRCRTTDVPSALDRVRQVAVRNKEERFSALLHHVTIERLRAAFLAVKRCGGPLARAVPTATKRTISFLREGRSWSCAP